MADRETELLLSSFGEYLLRSGLTDQRHGPYFVGWIRRYLGMVPRIPDATPNESLALFIDSLRRAQTSDWQVEQARQATSAWFAWRDGVRRAAPAPKVSVGPDGTVSAEAVQAAMRETLRVRDNRVRLHSLSMAFRTDPMWASPTTQDSDHEAHEGHEEECDS